MDVPQTEIRAPTRGNRKLEAFLEAVNEDEQVRAWWYMDQVHAERLGMSDHSWVHVQIVLNIGLRLFRLLNRRGLEERLELAVAARGGADVHRRELHPV